MGLNVESTHKMKVQDKEIIMPLSNHRKLHHNRPFNKKPLVFAIGLALGTHAQAATITVDVNAVDNIVNGNCSLIEAITSANTESAVDACVAGLGADTIELSATTFTLLAVDNTTDGYNGLPPIASEITIAGNGAVITRDVTAPYFRILHIAEPGVLTLQNATISGGSAAGTFFGTNGGGIFNRGDLTLTDSVVSGNTGIGGGIYNYGATMDVANSSVSNNVGDGVSNRDSITSFTNSVISGNAGEGISNVVSNATIVNSTISGNLRGLYNFYSTSTVSESTISGNLGFGGVFNFWSGTSVLDRTTISGNTSDLAGGGITNYYGTSILTNSTISGNYTANNGGAIYNDHGITVLSSVTVTGNTTAVGGYGAGIYEVGERSTTISNSILSNGGLGQECYGTGINLGNIFDGGHNWIEDDSCGVIPPGIGSINLGLLANNGGPTQTHALLVDSAALDMGNPRGCDGPLGVSLEVDQRGEGFVREYNGRCDIGAYEFQVAAPPPGSTACSKLGDNTSVYALDSDTFRFTGVAGETVTITLDVDVAGTSNGGTGVTLMLRDEIRRLYLNLKDKGPLPNIISTTVPKDGSYKIQVKEQGKYAAGEAFKGDYCVSILSDMDPQPTLTPDTRSIE